MQLKQQHQKSQRRRQIAEALKELDPQERGRQLERLNVSEVTLSRGRLDKRLPNPIPI